MTRKIDVRATLLVVVINSLCAVFLRDVFSATLTATTIALFNLYIKIDIKTTFKKLKRLWQVVLFASLMQSVFTKGGVVLLEVFGVNLITINGITQGAIIFLRFFSLINGATAIASYSKEHITESLVWFKVPFELSFSAVLGLSFLQKFSEQLKISLTAIELRGIELKSLSFKNKIKVYSYILFPVVSSVLLKAKDLSATMQTRGFKAFNKRTSMIDLKFTTRDFVTVAVMLLVQSIAIVWRLA